MHLILRIGREINAEHLRRKNFLVNLSQAIFSQHAGDWKQLMNARKAARLEGPPTRTERLSSIVSEPESVAKRMTLVPNIVYFEFVGTMMDIASLCGHLDENLPFARRQPPPPQPPPRDKGYLVLVKDCMFLL